MCLLHKVDNWLMNHSCSFRISITDCVTADRSWSSCLVSWYPSNSSLQASSLGIFLIRLEDIQLKDFSTKEHLLNWVYLRKWNEMTANKRINMIITDMCATTTWFPPEPRLYHVRAAKAIILKYITVSIMSSGQLL